MDNKLTTSPAPWSWDGKVWDYDSEQEAPWLLDANGKKVLYGEILCDNEANATLIAAAPDLLAAALKCIEFENEPRFIYGAINSLREAVAKATGSAP